MLKICTGGKTESRLADAGVIKRLLGYWPDKELAAFQLQVLSMLTEQDECISVVCMTRAASDRPCERFEV